MGSGQEEAMPRGNVMGAPETRLWAATTHQGDEGGAPGVLRAAATQQGAATSLKLQHSVGHANIQAVERHLLPRGRTVAIIRGGRRVRNRLPADALQGAEP